MPPGAVTAFRKQTGLTTRGLAELIGASRTALLSWDRSGGPLYIAYALAAIDAGIKPYKTKAATRISA